MRRDLLVHNHHIFTFPTLCTLHSQIGFRIVGHVRILVNIPVSDPEDGGLGEEYDGRAEPDPLR